jgi:Lrp/AsnC family transcriptional regulator
MDAIDKKILATLQDDASLSVAEIGSGSGCPRPRAGSGSRSSKADGVIQKRVALVDQVRIGLGITVFVSIEDRRSFAGMAGAFRRHVSAMPRR